MCLCFNVCCGKLSMNFGVDFDPYNDPYRGGIGQHRLTQSKMMMIRKFAFSNGAGS